MPDRQGPLYARFVMSEPAISIRAVRKQFGALQALDGIDLEVPRGAFFGLLGPNGAGKSTLINTIAGLVRADSGQLSVMGHDVVSDYQQARRSLGVVPQELVFDAFFSVREVLRIQAGYFGLGRENWPWIEELLSELRLTDKAESNMRSLSGGMKRRVLIAQALVHRPAVIILDEPTAGVDIEVRHLLWSLIRRLHKQGHTIILTTHYLEEAESLCEHIAIIDHGRLLALDSKQGLLARQGSQERTLRIQLADSRDHLPAALQTAYHWLDDYSCEIPFHDDCAGPLFEVIERFHGVGARIVEVQTERPDLEDVFLDMVYQRQA